MPIDSPNPFINRDDLLKLIRHEFIARDPKYVERRAKLMADLKEPAETISARQQAGEPAACAAQVFLEVKWLANYTENWPRADKRLADLIKALKEPEFAGARTGRRRVVGAMHHRAVSQARADGRRASGSHTIHEGQAVALHAGLA